MILSVRAAATYLLEAESSFCLMVEPALQGSAHRVIEAKLVTTPTVACELRQDLYGNPVRYLTVREGQFWFQFDAQIEVEPNLAVPTLAIEHRPQDLPPEVMVYTLPSRYCQSDLLARMANDEFGRLPPGGGRVLEIAAWVRRHVEYRYGTTDAMTSAYDTATERVGVCRDFAHLLIAFCRALGVPARYISGYAPDLDPPDFHGYVQVYVGGAWHNVDATSEAIRAVLVPIACGRDAADVAMATLWGRNRLIEQSVEVRAISPAINRP
jgi:transglutaminase-like putative cysteine protease